MKSNKVKIGNIFIGVGEDIAIQSMTNTDTKNIEETVKQCKDLFNIGSSLVRITVPTKNEIGKIKQIKKTLIKNNYLNPIIADIHYNAQIAIKTACFVDKIRINPGNYIEKRNLSDKEVKLQLFENFSPLLDECNKHRTSIRIGANHGSLSERILQKYGNTPLGMVKSVEDFLTICKSKNFDDIVVSMKASDPRVMIQACRLLQSKMIENKTIYPQHLGVTEAGNGNEARIKSAIGMATLLSEGIGDTIRVSLTENPLSEIPVAKSIVKYFSFKEKEETVNNLNINKLQRNYTLTNNKYIVISDYIIGESNLNADFYYINKTFTNYFKNQKYIIDYTDWNNKTNTYPLYTAQTFIKANSKSEKYNFIFDKISNFSKEVIEQIENDTTSVIIINTNEFNDIFSLRKNYNNFISNIKKTPVIIRRDYNCNFDDFIIKSAGETGAIFIDKLAGGLWLQNQNIKQNEIIDTAFSILQATKLRISKTEYVSCPTCGRTKFDIEKITSEVKQKTSQFKGITIAIMGCVVNGPGEMADADYGYVGAGNNLVHLYKNGKIFMKNINQENAVNELLKLLYKDKKETKI